MGESESAVRRRAFLPPGLGPTLKLYDGQAERLDEALHSRAKAKRVVRVGEVRSSDGGWCVTLDGAPIGMLGRGSDKRLREAHAAGYP